MKREDGLHGVANDLGDVASALAAGLSDVDLRVASEAAWLAWDLAPDDTARLVAYVRLALRADEALDDRVTTKALIAAVGTDPPTIVEALRAQGHRDLAEEHADALPADHYLRAALAQDRGEPLPQEAETRDLDWQYHQAAALRNAGDLAAAKRLAATVQRTSSDPYGKARAGLLLARILVDQSDLNSAITELTPIRDAPARHGGALVDHVRAQLMEIALEQRELEEGRGYDMVGYVDQLDWQRPAQTVSGAFDVLLASRVAVIAQQTGRTPVDAPLDDILAAATNAFASIRASRDGTLACAIAERHLVQLHLDLPSTYPVRDFDPRDSRGIADGHREHAWRLLIAGRRARREGTPEDIREARRLWLAAQRQFAAASSRGYEEHVKRLLIELE